MNEEKAAETDLSTARSTSEADDDFTVLPNGLVVTKVVQIWPIRSREVPTGADSASEVRMWMGEVRVDGAKIEEACPVKLRAVCKARWRSFWTCRNAHSMIEPGGIRYIQFEFPEPALDHLQLNLVAGKFEVKIMLERMPGTETFLWKDTTDPVPANTKIKDQRSSISCSSPHSTRSSRSPQRRTQTINISSSSSDVSSTSTGIETDLETAYSPTELSYFEDEEGPEAVNSHMESRRLSNESDKHSRSDWTAPRREWSDGTNSLRISEKVPSVMLDREPEALAASLSPALEESLRTALSSCGVSQRGTLFAMVHSVVVECLQQEGVEKATEVWKEIQRSYGSTPFVDTVLNRLEKSLEQNEIRTDNTCFSANSD